MEAGIYSVSGGGERMFNYALHKHHNLLAPEFGI
jgi:hypothetical protein